MIVALRTRWEQVLAVM